MREILFRGKRIDNGEWVEGSSIVCWDDGSCSIAAGDLFGACYAVDPATVGQYIGLTDKNGKKIFEGDIMRNPGNVVELCNGGFCINGDSSLAFWTGTEIIGNIHDNPELLGGNSP